MKGSTKSKRHVSDVLRATAADLTGENVSIRDLLHAFGERAFGLGVIVFALPNATPIPFIGALFGIPLIFLAVQMALGHPHPWLPQALMDRSMQRTRFVSMVDLVEPKLRKVESILKPRLLFLFSPMADRLIGFFVFLCALSIIVPLPGSNFPPAIGVIVVALAVIAEDGVALIIGVVIGLLGLGYTTAVIGGLLWASFAALEVFFGY